MPMPKKPTSLKVMEGTYRKDRGLNEPVPDTVDVTKMQPPEKYTDEQKAIWNEYVNELINLGVLTVVDRMAFQLMFETYIQLREVQDQISEDGLYVMDDRGNTRRNPLLSQANQLRQILKQYLTEFGMTPASRTRINVKEMEKELSPLEALIKKKMSGSDA